MDDKKMLKKRNGFTTENFTKQIEPFLLTGKAIGVFLLAIVFILYCRFLLYKVGM